MTEKHYTELIGDSSHPFGYRIVDDLDIRECFNPHRQIKLAKYETIYYVAVPKYMIGLSARSVILIVFKDVYEMREFIHDLYWFAGLKQCYYLKFNIESKMTNQELLILQDAIRGKIVDEILKQRKPTFAFIKK